MSARLVTRSVRGAKAPYSAMPELRAVWLRVHAMPMPEGVVDYAAGHAQRDEAEQTDALRRKVSRAAFGQSPHNVEVEVCPDEWRACALDIYPLVVRDGRKVVSGTASHYAAIGEAAAAEGVEWGGEWKRFRDLPHVQVRGWRKYLPDAEQA